MINVSRTAQNLRFDVPKQCLCSWALYRYFSIFLCHNKMNNKIKGFMENVGFVSFVLTWLKLFQPFQLHKSNWAYVVNIKFTSKKWNLASLRITSKMLCNRPFYSFGLSILAFWVNVRLRLVLLWYKPSFFSYENYTQKY